jgi:hypothetical protein
MKLARTRLGGEEEHWKENSKGFLAAGIVHVTDKSTVGNNWICNQHIFCSIHILQQSKKHLEIQGHWKLEALYFYY